MNPEKFLTEKYVDLSGSKPVERAVAKKIRQGEKGPDSKEARVEEYMKRLESIADDSKGWGLLKHKILDQFVVDINDQKTLAKIAESQFELEKRIAIEQGHGADIQQLESPESIIEHYKDTVKEKAKIQRKTVSTWLNYLQKNDAIYPTWFRYFVVRNLEKMGLLNKEKLTYSKRTATTIANFPELNAAALSWVYKRLEKGVQHEDEKFSGEKGKLLKKLIESKDFPRLYAFALVETEGDSNRESIKGEWRKYNQGSDYHVLENDLGGKGTGWCTAEGSAERQLKTGDFFVYFTENKQGVNTEPRLAIRMVSGQVVEVRGVNHQQEVEPELIDVAKTQYDKLPGGQKYDKKASDMKKLTLLTQKQVKDEKFTKEDLLFLYQTSSPIEGFGQEEDPRIQELLFQRRDLKQQDLESCFSEITEIEQKMKKGLALDKDQLLYLWTVNKEIALGQQWDMMFPKIIKLRNSRNMDKDICAIFECTKKQIAKNALEINVNTKVYLGKLEPGIFNLIQIFNIEHVYSSFPDRKIEMINTEVGNKSLEQLQREFTQNNGRVDDGVQSMVANPDFKALKKPEKIMLVKITLEDLGFKTKKDEDKEFSLKEISDRAEEFGLEACPAETAFYYFLNDPANKGSAYMTMSPIIGKYSKHREPGGHIIGLNYYNSAMHLKPVAVDSQGDASNNQFQRFYSPDSFIFRFRKTKAYTLFH